MKDLKVILMTSIIFTIAVSHSLLCSAAIPGYGLRFDGIDDYLSFPYDEDDMRTALPGNGTVEAWIKLDSIGTDRHVVISRIYSPMANTNYHLAVRMDGHPNFGFKVGDDTSNNAIADEAVEVGRWYHLAGTYDGSDIKIYVNGILSGSAEQTISPPPTTGYLGIGRNLYDLYYFPGMIDDVRLWEYTRTEEEIQSSMETGLLGTEPGLKAYWNFNEGDGPFVNDMTTNNTNGMLGSDGWPDIHDPEWVAIPEPTIILLGSLIMLAKLLIAYRK